MDQIASPGSRSAQQAASVALRQFYYPQIDGLRFVAFALVFLHHFGAPDFFIFPALNRIGWVGVDIFLVLSGFLIFSLLLIEHEKTATISLTRFYARRALRIWPLYFPFLIVILLLLPQMTGMDEAKYSLILKQHAFPFFTFLGNFSYAHFGGGSVDMLFAHLWTISLEEQFYLVVPFIVLIFGQGIRRWIMPTVIAIIIWCMLWRIYFLVALVPYPMVFVNPITRMDTFAIGALCAIVVINRPAWLSRPGIGLLLTLGGVAGLSSIAVSPLIGSTLHTTWQLSVVAASAGLLVLSCMAPWGIGRLLAWGPLPFLGKISFGLYVYHTLSLHIIAILPGAHNVWLLMALALMICIALATASYLLWERRFLRIKHRFELVNSRPA